MKPFSPIIRNRRLQQGGFALVIMLSIVVLSTILIVAFHSKSGSEYTISNASASSESSSILARTALDVVINDLRQEIADGSKTPADTTRPVFVPTAAVNAVPARTGTYSDFPNLLKSSIYNMGFCGTSGTKRASAISTGTASLEGIALTAERWNLPRLLPTTSATSVQPISSFVLPDWIYVTQSGSNCTSLDAVNKSNGTDPILGRYAYLIYNEGGVLDINSAGYPQDLSASDIAEQKSYLAFADLTKIGLSSTEIQKIVNWRNASVSGSSAAFIKKLKYDPSGFLQVAAGDRAFVSRQQLIDFFTKNNLDLTALAYLGTFSRGVNQPSFGTTGPNLPETAASVPTQSSNGSYTLNGYTGNNDADSSVQNVINPRLLDARVTQEFTRFSPDPAVTGTVTAKVGDPLIAKRFPLDRLAWLTYEGPIAPGGTLISDTQILQPLRDAGFSDDFLKLGTEDNIKSAFGLTWADDPAGSGHKVWVYDHGVSDRVIGRLSDVEGLGRDPDFLELLKASETVGSLGKGAASDPSLGLWEHARDIRVDFQLLQIFANIIDQFDSDGYPTEIALPTTNFDDATLLGLYQRKVIGVENLPYIYAMRPCLIMVRQSDPAMPQPVPNMASAEDTPVNDRGEGALLFHHWIWNPHSTLSGTTTARPTQFRIVSFPGDPAHSGSATLATLTLEQAPWGTSTTTGTMAVNRVTSQYNTMFAVSKNGTEMLFDIPSGTNLFTQPTALVFSGVPSGSDLRVGDSSNLKSTTEGSSGYLTDPTNEQKYVGALMAFFPLRDSTQISGTTYLQTVCYASGGLVHGTLGGQNGMISSLLQYSTGSGWVTYDVKCARTILEGRMDGKAPYDPVQPGVSTTSDGNRISLWADPRTRRFGSPFMLVSPAIVQTISSSDASLQTLRPSSGNGTALTWWGPGQALGPNPNNGGVALSSIGWIANSPATSQMTGNYYPQMLAENQASLPNAYEDPDGIVRGGMSWYAPSGSTIGEPQVTNNDASRPIILNRPFRSVAELGYVFRDDPWRQLDFFTPFSGDAALLDAFCVKEDYTPKGVVAGKVDLNTRNSQVLEAILCGVDREPSGAGQLIGDTEAASLASAICAWTQSTETGKGPFSSVGDLVGRYNSSSNAYESFFATNSTPFTGGTSSVNNVLQRYREAPLRALADVGEVRVWNLFIDLVTQAGFCGPSAASLEKFALRGETRWWIHLAIDRATGRVIDTQIENIPQ